jgi:hypothetical protein
MGTGKCVLTDGDVLIAMKCYYDGSGHGVDQNGDEWITLGAVAATDSVWAEFDNKWNLMLRERYPVAPYIHMIELLDHESPFDRVNGWTREKKRKLIADAIVVLSQMDKGNFRWFRFSLNTTAIQRAYLEGHVVPAKPHQIVALFMVYRMITAYVRSVVNREKIFLFFDRGDDFCPPVKREWLDLRTKPGLPPNPGNGWDLIENIEEVDQAFAPPIQVSDMVAWAHTRTLPTDEDRDFSDLKDLLLTFVPSTTLDITESVLKDQSKIMKKVLGIE